MTQGLTDIHEQVLIAEQQAKKLFNAVESAGLVQPGKSELELSNEVVELASRDFGINSYWHKRIVRAGPHTLEPFNGNPPDQVIADGDIVIIDFGPVYNGYEADLGRTFVLGDDPKKRQIKADAANIWQIARDWYYGQTQLTGAAFFHYISELSAKYGWAFGGDIAGHLVGPFPHEQPDDRSDLCFDIHPHNYTDILQPDKNGNHRHWILEVHLVDRNNKIGAFFEQLLQ